MNAELYWNKQSFVGDYGTSSRSSEPIVWLRGGNTTYRYRSLQNRVSLKGVNLETVVIKDLPYVPKTEVATKAKTQGLYVQHLVGVGALSLTFEVKGESDTFYPVRESNPNPGPPFAC